MTGPRDRRSITSAPRTPALARMMHPSRRSTAARCAVPAASPTGASCSPIRRMSIALGFGSGLSPRRARHRRARCGPGSSWCGAAARRATRRARWAHRRSPSLLGWWACHRHRRGTCAQRRSGGDRLGRGRRVLDRAVAASRPAGFWGQRGRLRAVPLLRRGQARPGGLGRPAASSCAAASRIGWAQGFGILFDDLVAALLHACW